jgi:small conductance mechanosensitive channel
MEDAKVWIDKGIEFITEFGPKLIGAVVLRGTMSKADYDKSLQKFLLSLAKWALTIFLIITVISTLGVETTSLAAVIAAAGLAIGLALQGSLSNFAGGVLIIIFKPYKIGDLVEAQGVLGSVKEIEIFTTKLITPQNKLAIVPNGAMANGNIINYTAEGKMRVDTTVGVDYGSDIKKTKEVLLAMLEANPLVLKDPAPSVNVEELADSSVNLAVRPFCKPEDYWDVYFGTIEGTKEALDKAGIEIPYPHEVQINK